MTITASGSGYHVGKDFADCCVANIAARGRLEYTKGGNTYFKLWTSTIPGAAAVKAFKAMAHKEGVELIKCEVLS